MDKVTAVVAGGKTRQESVNLGLNALSDKVKLAAVHDGARPLASWQLIDQVVRAANTYGAAAPAVSVKDTIKVVEGRIVKSTPDRASLYAVQRWPRRTRTMPSSRTTAPPWSGSASP